MNYILFWLAPENKSSMFDYKDSYDLKQLLKLLKYDDS